MKCRCNSLPPAGARECARGFTLIELLVVITLLALALGISAASLQRGSAGAKLESDARRLVSNMRYQRIRAMSEGIIVAVEPGEPGSYRTRPDDDIVELSTGLSLACETEGTTQGGGLPGINFYPDGSSNGGTCTLNSDAGSREISVNWLTGEVSLARAEG